MSRAAAREKYVELCRVYNNSGKYMDHQIAHSFLEGVRAVTGDNCCFDFCVAGDEAATADGFDGSCWGLASSPRKAGHQ